MPTALTYVANTSAENSGLFEKISLFTLNFS